MVFFKVPCTEVGTQSRTARDEAQRDTKERKKGNVGMEKGWLERNCWVPPNIQLSFLLSNRPNF